MRTTHFISRDKELAMIQKVIYNIKQSQDYYKGWFNPRETLMLMVSPDFSGIASTVISHALSDLGECMYTDCIHVPDPDEDVDLFKLRLEEDWPGIRRGFEGVPYKCFLLCEAGVISGRNFTWVDEFIRNNGAEDVKSIALFENKNSVYKSTFVGEYYNNDEQDLTFWWENPNRAFGDLQFL